MSQIFTTTKPSRRAFTVLSCLAATLAVACSGDPAGSAENGGGAQSTAGGQAAGVGGSTAKSGSGGSRSGTPASGATSAGGALGLGGATTKGSEALGGTGSVGGSSPSVGGNTSSISGTSTKGGTTSAAGGSTSKGGATSAVGGSTSKGGSIAKGGTTSVGGTTSKGGTTSAGGATGTLPNVTVYVAGDSTVSTYTDTAATNDQAGWGQMLKEIFNTKVTVVNRAAGGRTAYWFYLEGGVSGILSSIKTGDYFFIQFGTNDGNTTATFTVNGTTYPRYAAAGTLFKTQLKDYYLDPIKAKGAIPVLVTPPPRNSAYCTGANGLGAYATAMRELGAAENVAVLDNNLSTVNYLKAICPAPTTAAEETFFFGKADGTIDGTHFQENGARKMAGFIGTRIREVGLGLTGYLR